MKNFVNELVQAGISYVSPTAKWESVPLIAPNLARRDSGSLWIYFPKRRFTIQLHYLMWLLESNLTKLTLISTFLMYTGNYH